MHPKVSIIVPNYNHAEFLKQRLDSIFSQTFRDFEVIILDDCSGDASRSIIDSYRGHPKITEILYSQVNSGSPFLQWKKGIALASGEWIWIAESDDYASPDFLEKMINTIGDKKNIGLAYCDSRIISNGQLQQETFAEIKNRRYQTTRWAENYTNKGVAEIEDYLLPGSTINNTSAVLFNRRIFNDANPFDLSLQYIGDKYAFIKVLAKSDILYVKDGMNYFREPFNTKHTDRFQYYFYEQFQVFDWVYRNLSLKNTGKFFESFYSNTRNSLFTGWSVAKFRLYRKLLFLNTKLFIRNVIFNFGESWGSFFKRINLKT